MLASSKTLHTQVRRSACVHGATILMLGHVQLARLGCRGPGISQTVKPEKRVMPPSQKIGEKTKAEMKVWVERASLGDHAHAVRAARAAGLGPRKRKGAPHSERKRRQSQLRQLGLLGGGPKTT